MSLPLRHFFSPFILGKAKPVFYIVLSLQAGVAMMSGLKKEMDKLKRSRLLWY